MEFGRLGIVHQAQVAAHLLHQALGNAQAEAVAGYLFLQRFRGTKAFFKNAIDVLAPNPNAPVLKDQDIVAGMVLDLDLNRKLGRIVFGILDGVMKKVEYHLVQVAAIDIEGANAAHIHRVVDDAVGIAALVDDKGTQLGHRLDNDVAEDQRPFDLAVA